MRSALASVPGVDSVEVDFAAKTATVSCSAECDTQRMLAALEDSGFGGTLRKE